MAVKSLVERAWALAPSPTWIETPTEIKPRAAVMQSAAAIGESLRQRGVRAGDRVMLSLPASLEWVETFFGVLHIGAIVVPVATTSTPRETEHVARDSGAKLLISGDGWAWLDAPEAEAAHASVALILYTSGTTGAPKGALITHENLLVQTAALADAWAIGGDDVLAHALPMHHLHGIVVAFLTTFLAPASVVLLPKFVPELVLATLARATVFMAVPTMYTRLLEAIDRAEEGDRATYVASLRGLRLITSGSAALPASLAARIQDVAGVIPLERYGMTEIGIALANPLDPSRRRIGHVGTPLPSVEARILDDPSGPGELQVRGPSVFAGYHGRPSDDLFDDGWFSTGDVAVRDADGFIRLLGRASVDILKSGGEKISALEIEEVFREHPSVAEVAIVGLPDELWGDRVVAAIVKVPDETRDEPAIARDLEAFARARLAPFKIPKQLVFFDALPRNAMGKVVKPELARAVCQKLDHPAQL